MSRKVVWGIVAGALSLEFTLEGENALFGGNLVT